MEHTIKINKIDKVTHDVKRFECEKPEGYTFDPGQATEVAIDLPDWKEEKRPFTFTSLNEDPYLEFIIKGYPEHEGVTQKLHQLSTGDSLIIDDPWGAITYQGPGDFIAGGAGVTPFIAILRQLHKDGELNGNRLIFSNKKKADIILHDEFQDMLGNRFFNTLTEEHHPDYFDRMIDRNFLEELIDDFSKSFYVCGPPAFVEDIQDALEQLGAETNGIVIEE